jgi:hypothetical protein
MTSILVNGSFEEASTACNEDKCTISDVPGWTSNTNEIEVLSQNSDKPARPHVQEGLWMIKLRGKNRMSVGQHVSITQGSWLMEVYANIDTHPSCGKGAIANFGITGLPGFHSTISRADEGGSWVKFTVSGTVEHAGDYTAIIEGIMPSNCAAYIDSVSLTRLVSPEEVESESEKVETEEQLSQA